MVLSESSSLCSAQQLGRTNRRQNRRVRIVSRVHYCVGVASRGPAILCRKRPVRKMSTIVPHVNTSGAFCNATIIHRFRVVNIFATGASVTVSHSQSGLQSLRVVTHHNVNLPMANFTRSAGSVSKLISVINNTPLIVGLLRNARKVNIILTRARRTTGSIVRTFHKLSTGVLIRRFVGRTKKVSVHYFIVNSGIITTVGQRNTPKRFHSGLRQNNSTDQMHLAPRRHDATVQTTGTVKLQITKMSLLHSGRNPIIVRIGSSPKLRNVRGTARISINNGVVSFIIGRTAPGGSNGSSHSQVGC